MSGHYHAIIWIDHHEARAFHFGQTDVDRLVQHPDNPSRHIHHKANSIGSGHASEDQEFFHRVVEAIDMRVLFLLPVRQMPRPNS
jgi:hypothetical protein